MLDFAIKYKDQLEKKFINILGNDRYKFWTNACFVKYPVFTEKSEWNSITRVSVINGEIIGYFDASIRRPENYVEKMSILSFVEGSPVVIKDLALFVKELFVKYKYYKMNFSVLGGNPAKKIYDKFINKYGGRIAGVYKKDVMLIDGLFYDSYIYEIFREDYLTRINS